MPPAIIGTGSYQGLSMNPTEQILKHRIVIRSERLAQVAPEFRQQADSIPKPR